MKREIRIGKRAIGSRHPVFVVAELSGNHKGDIKRALKIIDVAAEAGADAVKLQTYTPDTMTINSRGPLFVVKTNPAWKGKTLYELYKEAHTPWSWHKRLFAHAKKRGLICFSTPFDETAVDFLETLKAPIYKVASFEIVDIPLLKRIGRTKKPVILSRGMASREEIARAVRTLRKSGTKDIVLLHCVSAYPAKPKDMNLKTIPDLKRRFHVEIGLSDHTLGNDVAITAVALGATVVEKHVTLKRSEGGPDAAFSLEPRELKALVKSIRTAEAALGKPTYARNPDEKQNIVFRRSLFVVQDVKRGERFTKKNLRSIRPGYGLAPRFYDVVLGKRATRNIARGTPLSWTLIRK
ncbi:pseudaminic acid synthase [Candidatus Kaiserbacteria bacterium]|nr:pseudaminic acid synthase [Candidatus Kaiserbacteria bacterium]